MNVMLTPEILRRETCVSLSNMTQGLLHWSVTQHQFTAECDGDGVCVTFTPDGRDPLWFAVPAEQLAWSLYSVDQKTISPRCAEIAVAMLPPEVLYYWAV